MDAFGGRPVPPIVSPSPGERFTYSGGTVRTCRHFRALRRANPTGEKRSHVSVTTLRDSQATGQALVAFEEPRPARGRPHPEFAMEFACDRCQKRFSTSYQPVTGRVYRIPCKCGNTIVLRFDLPRHAEPPPFPRGAASRMTPPPLPDRYLCMENVRARATSTMNTMTVGDCATAPVQTSPVQTSPPRDDGAARARLDPTASPEVSGEYPYEPSSSVPFGLAFAQSRRRAFLAGCGAGASGAIALLGAVTLVAWLSGPRSGSRVMPASTVTNASKTEQAPAPLAAANATVGGDQAAPDVPRRVKRAPRVVAAPLVEKVAASHPTAVDREDAARADDDVGEDNPASDDGAEPKQLAESEDGEASDGAEADAQTTEGQGPALDERAAAATEAPEHADESSNEPGRVALVPAVEPEQTSAPDGAPGAPANEDRAQ